MVASLFKLVLALITQIMFSKDSFERRWEHPLFYRNKKDFCFPKIMGVPQSSWFRPIKNWIISWDINGLFSQKNKQDKCFFWYKNVDTVQPSCAYLEEASSYFI